MAKRAGESGRCHGERERERGASILLRQACSRGILAS